MRPAEPGVVRRLRVRVVPAQALERQPLPRHLLLLGADAVHLGDASSTAVDEQRVREGERRVARPLREG